MGRKRIYDLDSVKVSVDVEGKNKKVLDALTKNLGMKYSGVVNRILSTFWDMPADISKEFRDFIFDRYCELDVQIKEGESCDKPLLKNKRDYYMNMAQLLKCGKPIEPQEISMKKISLKNGYLVYPRDWIVVNPEDAAKSMYVGCVECKHHKEYGIPHMLFLSNFKYGDEYPDEFLKEVNSMCIRAWPDFKEILEKQVPLISGLRGEAKKINRERHLESPIIGYFHIWEEGDIDEPPYGTKIVREFITEE